MHTLIGGEWCRLADEVESLRGAYAPTFHGITLHINRPYAHQGRILCKHDGVTEAMSQYIYYPIPEPIATTAPPVSVDTLRDLDFDFDAVYVSESSRWFDDRDKIQEIMSECRQWIDEDLQSIRRVLTQEGKRRKNESQ